MSQVLSLITCDLKCALSFSGLLFLHPFLEGVAWPSPGCSCLCHWAHGDGGLGSCVLLGIAMQNERECSPLNPGVGKCANGAAYKKQNVERGVLNRTLKESSLLPGTVGPEKWSFTWEEKHDGKIATQQVQCWEARTRDHLDRMTTLGTGPMV